MTLVPGCCRCSRRGCGGGLVLGLHEVNEVDHPTGVAVLVIIPGHELHKCIRETNAGFLVKYGGSLVSKEVSGHNVFLAEAKNTFHGTL